MQKSEVEDITAPLFQATSITWFCYTVVNLQEKTVGIISNLPGYDNFRKSDDFPLAPLFLDDGYYWLSEILPQKNIELYRTYNIDNIFTVIKKHGKYVEDFSFGTPSDEKGMINYYINNIHILESFIAHFKTAGNQLVEKTQLSMTEIPHHLIPIDKLNDTKESISLISNKTHQHIKNVNQFKSTSSSRGIESKSDTENEFANLEITAVSNIKRLTYAITAITKKKLTINFLTDPIPIDQYNSIDEMLNKAASPLGLVIVALSTRSAKLNLAKGNFIFLKDVFKPSIPREVIFSKIGLNGMLFHKNFKTFFDINLFHEPVTIENIQFLYQKFDKLDKDLTDDVRWAPFIEYIKSITSIFEKDFTLGKINYLPYKLLTLSETIIMWILELYRNAIIELASYQKIENKSKKQFMQNHYFYKHWLTYINNSKAIQLKPKECHYNMIELLTETFGYMCNEGFTYITDVIKNEKFIKKLDELIKIKINHLQNSSEYICLGVKSNEQLRPLLELKKKYLNLLSLIKKEVKLLSSRFIPNPSSNLEKSVSEMIADTAKVIEKSTELKALGVLGLVIVKRYLLSGSTLNQIHARALKARIDYFSQFIPEKINNLTSDKTGINWLKYYQSKNEVLLAIHKKYIFNPNPEEDVCTHEQKCKLLKTLQVIYFEALHELYSSLPQISSIENEINNILNSPLLGKYENGKITGLAENLIYDEINKIKKSLLAVNPIEPHHGSINLNSSLLLFSNQTSPQVDISVGLVNKLSKDLKGESIALNEKEMADIFTTDQNDTNNLLKLLFFKDDHKKLIEEISKIKDPADKMSQIKDISDNALDASFFSDYSFLAAKLKKGDHTTTQIHLLEKLQDLYIQTLDKLWKQKANQLASNKNTSDEIPSLLAVEDKAFVYEKILQPASDEPLISCLPSNERISELLEMIFDMEDALLNIPEPSEDTNT